MRLRPSVVRVPVQSFPKPVGALFGVVNIGIVMPAEIIIRSKVGRIFPDRLLHLIAKEDMLPSEIVSHPKRLRLAGITERANGSGRIVANDCQNAAARPP